MFAILALFALSAATPSVSYREGVVDATDSEIRTADGRAEVRWSDDSIVHLDNQTRLLLGPRLHLADGRLFIRTTATTLFDLDTPLGRLRLGPAGAYNIVVDSARAYLLISVAVGRANLDTPYGTTSVSGREMTMMTGATARPFVTPFDPARWDRFELWSDDRMLRLAYGPDSPWPPGVLARIGLVVDRFKAASVTCSSWLSHDNPCWIIGTVVPPSPKPQGPSPQVPKPQAPSPRPPR